MRTLFVAACVVVILTMVAGCGAGKSDGKEAVIAMTAAFNGLADRLSEIRTASQFTEAEQDLEKIGGQIREATEQMKALEQLPEAENKAIAEKYGMQMAEARRRVMIENERLMDIDLLANERIAHLLGQD